MKTKQVSGILMALVFSSFFALNALAQTTGEAINKKVGLYVYPAKGQTADQQTTDK